MKTDRTVVILVCPENPDNIGAVARAVKNMGFSDLRLVTPPQGWRTKARKMAVSAEDVLKQALVFSSLQKAISDLGVVVGTSRRGGGHRGAFLPFDAGISKIREVTLRQKVGIVFGRESKGLSNDESDLCDYLVTIPTGAVYPSLNLAQAVMVMLFALIWHRRERVAPEMDRALDKKGIEETVVHFEQALHVLGYRRGGADLLPRILKTLRGLIKRAGLLEPEAQMIKGLSRRIREKVLSCSRSPGRMNKKES